MGLLYTKFYLDFDETEWKQISSDPLIFETIKKDVSLEIEDASHKSYHLVFKEQGKIKVLRVAGKFRLMWDDDDLISLL